MRPHPARDQPAESRRRRRRPNPLLVVAWEDVLRRRYIAAVVALTVMIAARRTCVVVAVRWGGGGRAPWAIAASSSAATTASFAATRDTIPRCAAMADVGGAAFVQTAAPPVHRSRWTCTGGVSFGRHLSSLSSGKGNGNDGNGDHPPSTPRPWDRIESTKSATVKKFKSLATKRKARVEDNAALLEGHRLVLDALSDPTVRPLFRHVVVTESALKRGDIGVKLEQELHSLSSSQEEADREGEGGGREQRCRVSVGTDAVVNACADTVTPQGVVAIVSLPPPYNPDDSSARAVEVEEEERGGGDHSRQEQLPPPLYLLLDGVSDPGNVGTLLRSSLAVGVEAVLFLPGSCDAWNPKAVRGGMGSSFRVPLVKMESFRDALDLLKRCGVSSERLYAATMDVANMPAGEAGDCMTSYSSPAHYEVDWATSGPVALCVGSEGNGLSRDVRDAVAKGAIRSAHVPMERGIESLNAAVCGSIILFE